jgi:hypothetical protein
MNAFAAPVAPSTPQPPVTDDDVKFADSMWETLK